MRWRVCINSAAMIMSCASLLPASSSSFGRGAVASIAAGAPAMWTGTRSSAAFIPSAVKTAFSFPAALSPKICPAPSNNALVLRSVRAAAWPLAMSGGGSRWQSGAPSSRGGRGGGGGGRGGRSRPLLPSERRVLERQRKDGSISPENLALLSGAMDREMLDREMQERRKPQPQSSTPRAPKREAAPPPAWAAQRMGPQGGAASGAPETMGGSEKKVLQARRSRGEISSVDLARCVPGRPIVSISSVHGLYWFSLGPSCLALLYGSMRFHCTLLSFSFLREGIYLPTPVRFRVKGLHLTRRRGGQARRGRGRWG